MIRHSVVSTKPDADLLLRFVEPTDRESIPPQILAAELTGKTGEFVLHHAGKTLFAGASDSSEASLRFVAGSAMRRLSRLGRSSIAVDLRRFPELCGPVLEAMEIGALEVNKHQNPVQKLIFWVNPKSAATARKSLQRGKILADATNFARKTANLRPNLCSPETIAREAAKVAKETGLKCRILNEKQLATLKCDGLLAVGSGSETPPRLIFLEHAGGKPTEPWQALVGKAVTFDTGGLCIKPRDAMHEMVWDKCGGTAVIGAMQAIAKLGLKKNVVGVIAAAENMPDSKSYRPGDILTISDGTTVEVLDTDAEGRLALADAMVQVRKGYSLSLMIDISTLTGAIGIALGTAAAGMWSSDSGLAKRLETAASETCESIWHMPLFPEYEEHMKSHFADLRNAGGRLAGACTGAAFLKWFAKETPWAHLDVAEVAYFMDERPNLARGATGFGVRLMVRAVELGG